MASVIILSALISESNSDILNATRLQTAPKEGTLTFQIQTDLAVAANHFDVSIQLPSGDTPLENILVPAGSGASGEVPTLDSRQMLQATFPIAQGGHVVFGVVLIGTAELAYRVTFTPA